MIILVLILRTGKNTAHKMRFQYFVVNNELLSHLSECANQKCYQKECNYRITERLEILSKASGFSDQEWDQEKQEIRDLKYKLF